MSDLEELKTLSKFGYSLGNAPNEMFAAMWFSYSLIYFKHILGCDDSVSGTLFLVGQIADALASPISGYLVDNFYTKRCWFFAGILAEIVSFPVMFTTCPGCSRSAVVQLLFLLPFVVVFQAAWSLVQISHLAINPEIADQEGTDRHDLTTYRYGVGVIANCIVYISMICVLAINRDGNQPVNADDWSRIRIVTILVLIISGLTVCAFASTMTKINYSRRRTHALSLYPAGHNDPSSAYRKWNAILRSPVLYQTALLYVCARIYFTSSLVFIPLWQNERILARSGDLRPGSQSAAYLPPHLDSASLLTMNLQHFGFRSDQQRGVPRSTTPESNTDVMHIAIIPLVMFVASFGGTLWIRWVHDYLRPKLAYLIGSMVSFCACLWVAMGVGNNALAVEVCMVAILFGVGSSVTVISSMSLTTRLIGAHVERGGMIWAVVAFADKLLSGMTVWLIELIKCEPDRCPEYYRNVLSGVCGFSALLGMAILASLQYTEPELKVAPPVISPK